MEGRLKYGKAFPDGVHALLNLGKTINATGFDEKLLHLVFTRASQLNGCAYCIDMHTKDARALGETEQRLYALNAWRETPFFSHRERAALAWTEAITNIQTGHAPEAIYQEALREFGEPGLAQLTWAVAYINTWNRIAIAFRSEPGTYQPKAKAQAAASAAASAPNGAPTIAAPASTVAAPAPNGAPEPAETEIKA
jgi:AhpD family alkylhydroperoxidase